MKVLLVSTSDVVGGGFRAAYRLHRGLLNLESVESEMLVQLKGSHDPAVIGPSHKFARELDRIRRAADRLPLKFCKNKSDDLFSCQWVPDKMGAVIKKLDPHVVNIHWSCGGFLRIETLAHIHKPTLLTLHDMWPFTGGCHYSGDCERYKDSCGTCPQLGSKSQNDLSRWVWNRKNRAWKKLNFALVAPSRWMANCAQKSSLFKDRRIEVIPNGLDLNVFKPMDMNVARSLLNIPQDKKVVLFGALNALSDQRKGFHVLQPALKLLAETDYKDSVLIVVFGADAPSSPCDFGGIPVKYLGHLYDEPSLVAAYSAADVMIVPSLQENLGQTATEALACGVPVVAFNIGGLPDLIDHQQNGYLAKTVGVNELAGGIQWILDNGHKQRLLKEAARSKAVNHFSISQQVKSYLELFTDIAHMVPK